MKYEDFLSTTGNKILDIVVIFYLLSFFAYSIIVLHIKITEIDISLYLKFIQTTFGVFLIILFSTSYLIRLWGTLKNSRFISESHILFGKQAFLQDILHGNYFLVIFLFIGINFWNQNYLTNANIVKSNVINSHEIKLLSAEAPNELFNNTLMKKCLFPDILSLAKNFHVFLKIIESIILNYLILTYISYLLLIYVTPYFLEILRYKKSG